MFQSLSPSTRSHLWASLKTRVILGRSGRRDYSFALRTVETQRGRNESRSIAMEQPSHVACLCSTLLGKSNGADRQAMTELAISTSKAIRSDLASYHILLESDAFSVLTRMTGRSLYVRCYMDNETQMFGVKLSCSIFFSLGVVNLNHVRFPRDCLLQASFLGFVQPKFLLRNFHK